MAESKITFKKAGKADKKLILDWLCLPHVKAYWDKSDELAKQLDSALKGDQAHPDFWICLSHNEPFGLILASDASLNPSEPLIPWIEEKGRTLLIDFMICETPYLGKGLGADTLKGFAQAQSAETSALLAAPEVKNEKGMHVYEEAGFVRVSTFIKGQGFFKGKPHYLLKLKINSK